MKQHYKIAFCGLGSIGQRHLKNTVKYLQDNYCTFQIDAIRSHLGAEPNAELQGCLTAQYSYQEDIPRDYDIIFITNPTALHAESILKYKDCTKSMFIEKPVTDNINFNLAALQDDLICYVACPLRYTQVLQFIKKHVACEQAYSVRAICSTYLPDWHPAQDYRNSYSTHKDMGGGVAIDLIHEWDYLIWLFGMPDMVKCIQRHISALEVDCEDVAVYIGSSDSKVYELHLDYFGRQEIRELEIFLPEETIKADLHNGSIYFGTKQEKIVLEESRDEYQMREIEHFFNIIEGRCLNDNDLVQAINTLKITKEIV